MVLGLVLFLLPLHALVTAGPASCSLCIVEVQTQGVNSGTEDYVVLANNSNTVYPISVANPVTLKYFTAGGTNTKSHDITITTSLAANSVLAYVSDSLHAANPLAGSFPAGLAFSDTGGTLELIQNGLVLDEVGWGTASLHETTVAPTHKVGEALMRQQTTDGWQDNGDNSADFAATAHACIGLALNEIQPFAVDTNGDDIDPAIELLASNPAATDQDCPIQINGVSYAINAADIGAAPGLSIITQVTDSSAVSRPVPLHDSTSNALQFMPTSLFGGLNLPGASLTQPVLLPGQSYVKISSSWKATYFPTIGLANQYSATAAPLTTPTASQTDSCDQVVMNELLPNPVGDDTGEEWLELRSLSHSTVFLANCAVVVNGTQYTFAPDEWVGGNQFPVFANFSDGQTTRTLSLKNSGVSTLSFGHLTSGGNFTALQTIQYQDAPEGQSWARFDEGWRWLPAPNPGEDNATVPDTLPTNSAPTEFPAPTSTGDTDGQLDDSSVTTQPQVMITELLPNPAAPQTDEENEFVELYNPGIDALDLDGYKVQTGSNYSYSFTITNQTIAADGYLVLSSGNTGLTLANSAGQARLLDSNGTTVSETDAYQNAADGLAWALSDGKWQWTSTPTPGSANAITIGTPLSSSKKTASKKTTTKAAKTTKPKVKAAKTTKTKTTATVDESDNTTPPVQPLHMAVLVAVGAVALLYGAYEYRHDMANLIYKLRRNRETRRVARA